MRACMLRIPAGDARARARNAGSCNAFIAGALAINLVGKPYLTSYLTYLMYDVCDHKGRCFKNAAPGLGAPASPHRATPRPPLTHPSPQTSVYINTTQDGGGGGGPDSYRRVQVSGRPPLAGLAG